MDLNEQIKETEATLRALKPESEKHLEDITLREDCRVLEENLRSLCAARTKAAREDYVRRFAAGLFR